METTRESVHATAKSSHTPDVGDPLVIGAGALVLGYVIGTGRWNWLTEAGGKVTRSLGNLTLHYLYESFQKQNPQLFVPKDRVTH